MSRRRRHHEAHEEHVNHEAWVIPYADMLTLLMAMFLVLWAIGQVDVSKAKAVSTGFADQFGLSSSAGRGAGGTGVLDGVSDSADGAEQPVATRSKPDRAEAVAAFKREQQATDQREIATEQLREVERRLSGGVEQVGLGGAVSFAMQSRGLIVSVTSEGVLFPPGSAELTPEGHAVLRGLGSVLAGIPNQLSIEGHTDDRPISTDRYPSNWELSTARSTSVLRELVSSSHIPAGRVAAAGYGDQRPVASNADDAGRARNRRVDIAVLMTDQLKPPGADRSANPGGEG